MGATNRSRRSSYRMRRPHAKFDSPVHLGVIACWQLTFGVCGVWWAAVKLGGEHSVSTSAKVEPFTSLRAWTMAHEAAGRHLKCSATQLKDVLRANGDYDSDEEEDPPSRHFSKGKSCRSFLESAERLTNDAKGHQEAAFKLAQNAISARFGRSLSLDEAWRAGEAALLSMLTAAAAGGAVQGTAQSHVTGPGAKVQVPGQAKETRDQSGKLHPSKRAAARADHAAGLGPPPGKKSKGKKAAGTTPATTAATVQPTAAVAAGAGAQVAAAAGTAGAAAQTPLVPGGPRPPPGPPPPGTPQVCIAFTTRGTCNFGAACRFRANTPGHP